MREKSALLPIEKREGIPQYHSREIEEGGFFPNSVEKRDGPAT